MGYYSYFHLFWEENWGSAQLVSKDDHFSLSRQWTKNLSHKKNFKLRRTVWQQDHHQFSEILIISSSKSSCGLSKFPDPKMKKNLANNFCLCPQEIPEILLINSVSWLWFFLTWTLPLKSSGKKSKKTENCKRGSTFNNTWTHYSKSQIFIQKFNFDNFSHEIKVVNS